MTDPPETIQLLRQWHGGDRAGLDALLENFDLVVGVPELHHVTRQPQR